MAAVAPSPPIASTLVFSSRPRALSATSMPDATAAEFSKREWMAGTIQADSGYLEVVISIQPVAKVQIMLGPAALRASRKPKSSPQPEQAVGPRARRFCFLSLIAAF